MDAETRLEEKVLRERARRRRLGLGLAGLALALGCFTQKPSRESTPSAPAMPAAAPSSEAELPAEQAAPPPLPSSESSREQKQEEPASGKGAPPAASPSVAPPRRAAPAKPASKARSASPESAADRAIGGNADDVERDAPALRQRLDRAYRAGSPDCPSARERKKAVCDLATQICQLTDRDPNVASVAEYCSEAKQRCSQAEQRTQERCPD
jgi:hypothetical protein